MPSVSIQRVACAVSLARGRRAPLMIAAPGTGATMFSRTLRSAMMPSCLRSAATKPMPAALPRSRRCAAGRACRRCAPSLFERAAGRRNSARPSVSMPEPTSPKTPKISPRADGEARRRRAGRRRSGPSTVSTSCRRGCAVARCRRDRRPRCRAWPDSTSSARCVAGRRRSPALRPSRSTTMRSEIANTSLR